MKTYSESWQDFCDHHKDVVQLAWFPIIENAFREGYVHGDCKSYERGFVDGQEEMRKKIQETVLRVKTNLEDRDDHNDK